MLVKQLIHLVACTALAVREVIMICVNVNIPQSVCEIDDELKAIYHSKDTVCIWVFQTRAERNRFMDETIGMSKAERQAYFERHFCP